jgi:hypothetical protein
MSEFKSKIRKIGDSKGIIIPNNVVIDEKLIVGTRRKFEVKKEVGE